MRGIAAIPFGNSCAKERVNPSIAHLEAQYGATWAEVEREHPVLEDLPFLRKYRRKEPCALVDYEPRKT
ncbi:MAG: hypothetical protein V7L13_14045, partial [Nostoc sp.]|uniref:hypothetical protein n=1 Tax=Nostoc sp. TaxID=1180 RepID=UPI002FFD46FB